MRQFSNPARPIVVAVDELFAVVLEGNPTTGFRWEAEPALPHLEVLGRRFQQRMGGIGAGGKEVFDVHALEAGRAEIVFEYRRQWSGEARETRRFEVIIQ